MENRKIGIWKRILNDLKIRRDRAAGFPLKETAGEAMIALPTAVVAFARQADQSRFHAYALSLSLPPSLSLSLCRACAFLLTDQEESDGDDD